MEKRTGGAGAFAKAAKKEWNKIIWPDTDEVRAMTAMVFAAGAAAAAAAAAIDAGMMTLIGRLLGA